MRKRNVVLQPVAMRTPQSGPNPVLEPSKLESTRTIDEAVFLEQYDDQPKNINVSNQQQTGYSNGLDCWYVVVDP